MRRVQPDLCVRSYLPYRMLEVEAANAVCHWAAEHIDVDAVPELPRRDLEHARRLGHDPVR
jgi:hypothetical protein